MSGGYLYGVSTNPNNSSYTGDGTQSHTLTINEMPNHKHSLGWGPNNKFIKMTNEKSDENSYGFDFHKGYLGDTSGGYNNTQALPVGGGQGHAHQVAYIGVFIWKRIS